MSERKNLDTGTEHLMAYLEDRVGVVVLNRPQARNALSREMLGALADKLAEFEVMREVGAVVITGAGKGFCAGGDVKGFHQSHGDHSEAESKPTLDEAIHRQRLNQQATTGKIYRMPKPVIAALPGAAAGAGMSIALAADFRIFAENAFISSAFGRVGFGGDYGGTYFLSKLVGMSKAKEIYYFSDRYDAEECRRLGIANWVVPADQLMQEAMKHATRLANGPTISLRYFKENINRAYDGGAMEDCLDLEVSHHLHCGLTEDHKEAVAAFVEKRDPVFRGR